MVRYAPTLPAAGFYPVYCWALTATNRASQLYRVVHSGGASEIRVDHRRVGNGWVWLGTYYFNAGASGCVEISNQSADGSVVIADAIRFGNGKGDVNQGGGVSGYLRAEEAARYWLQRSNGILSNGNPGDSNVYDYSSSDGNDSIHAPPRAAAYMNLNTDYFGQLYLGFHSNAASTTARGCVALITNYNGSPNKQAEFATLLANELDHDSLIEDANWEYTWSDRASPTYTSAYSEISNVNLNSEMTGTIVEVAFHDNAQDAALMRDPKVRAVFGRACYKAIVRYFNQYGGGPLAMLPEPPTHVRAVNLGAGRVQVSWEAPPSGGAGGDAATGYRVYISENGYGFDGGTDVSGAAARSYTFSNLGAGRAYYFRVAATNAGGESFPTEVMGARVTPLGGAPVLVVNGFDRFDRNLDVKQYIGNNINGTIDRIRPIQMNAYNYVVQHGDAIAAADIDFDSTSNEAVIRGDVNLANYKAVVWILGEESTADKTLDATERAKVQTFLESGGRLFISGTDLGYELQGTSAATSFFNSTLKASYVSNSSGSYQVAGAGGSIFNGITLSFAPGEAMYNAESADVLAAAADSQLCASYTGSSTGGAAILYQGGLPPRWVVVFGFPFEAINGVDTRNQVMKVILDFFGLSPAPPSRGAWLLH